jgi:hypothetical protein
MNAAIKQPESALSKTLFWSPRIICILAILFISIFALDAFSPGLSVWQQIGAFIMHLIPSMALAMLLVFSWKHEKWGGTLFLLVGLIFTPIIFNWNYRMNNSVWISLSVVALITLPFVIVGILFLAHDFVKKRAR